MRPSLVRAAALAAAAITGGALLVHGWHAIRTACYVDLVSGVWLALADDLRHGVFYRPLVGVDGYGGTRYFPLFFASISALMRLGAGALASGFAVSLAGAVVLVTGLRRILSGAGAPPELAWAGGLFVLAPHFAQQTLFAIRSDLLAAGFVLWGVALAQPLFDEDPPPAAALAASSACFVIAAATKVTSLYGPASAVLALALIGQRRTAVRLALAVGLGTSLMIAGAAAASGGRAIESWRACASAGASLAAWARSMPSAFLSGLLLPSRTFLVLLGCAAAAWLDLVRRVWPHPIRPGDAAPARNGLASRRAGLEAVFIVLLPAALAATAVIVASPGAIFTNQAIDAFAASIVVVFMAVSRRRWEPALAVALLALALVASARTAGPVLDGSRAQRDRQRRAERLDLIRSPALWTGLVWSESPELPVQAGARPYLIDPFALRVVTLRRPDILADVLRALDERRFSAVLLAYDPLTPRGRGFYTNLNFGWPITSRIVANYERVSVQGGIHIYRPRPARAAAAESERP